MSATNHKSCNVKTESKNKRIITGCLKKTTIKPQVSFQLSYQMSTPFPALKMVVAKSYSDVILPEGLKDICVF